MGNTQQSISENFKNIINQDLSSLNNVSQNSKDLKKGMRGKLDEKINVNNVFQIKMTTSGNAQYDNCCFGVDDKNKLSDDRYMVFYNQKETPNGEIRLEEIDNSSIYNIDLTKLPISVNKLVYTVNIDGNGNMSQIQSHKLELIQNGVVCLQLDLTGKDFSAEKAIIDLEIYKKDVWRYAVIASGFNGGLADLLKNYGGELKEEKEKVEEYVQKTEKISLKKGEKVNLIKDKNKAGLGEIVINLNWNARESRGLFGFSNIDLDLGCLYELKNGEKGCVQALGNSFGSTYFKPFIALDGDDRTGNCATGENLRINGDKVSEIKRILVYTFIYEGVANWQQANGKVTIKYPGAPDIIINMDSYDNYNKMCALALFENVNDMTFSVQKLIQYFDGHRSLDNTFGWGMRWVPGRK